MRTYRIPDTDLEVTRIAYGCMKLGGSWDQEPPGDGTHKTAFTALNTEIGRASCRERV